MTINGTDIRTRAHRKRRHERCAAWQNRRAHWYRRVCLVPSRCHSSCDRTPRTYRGHQLGNSLGALRQFAALGVRYVTLTHMCHNVFADSCGFLDGIEPLHHGLRCVAPLTTALSTAKRALKRDCDLFFFARVSPFGEILVRELNRLGVLVDLSHTSDDTARAALNISRAPVIWSHSSARALRDVARNVPDDVLRHIGTGTGQRDGIVMVCHARYAHQECGGTIDRY